MDHKYSKWFFILLAALTFEALAVLPQTVTFYGTVSRHELTDINVEVSGNIHIRYGEPASAGASSDVLVPFTIPSGERSVEYSQRVDWSLTAWPDEDDSTFPSRRFSPPGFRLELSCTQNCDEAGIYAPTTLGGGLSQMYFTNSGKTSPDVRSAFKFVADEQRLAYYNADLTLLSRFIDVKGGRISLPKNRLADENIEVTILAMTNEPYPRNTINPGILIERRTVTIAKGQNSVSFPKNFDLYIQDDVLFTRITHLAYTCTSDSCKRHGLLPHGWLGSSSNKVFTSDHYDTSPLNWLYNPLVESPFEEDSFTLNIPGPIILNEKASTSLMIVRNKNDSSNKEIKGKIIVEKADVLAFCFFENRSLLSFQAFYPVCRERPSALIVDEIVSSTPFVIGKNEHQLKLTVPIEQMRQPGKRDLSGRVFNTLDVQRIRFECEEGCNSKSGYLRERRLGPPIVFTSTQDFEGKVFKLELSNHISIAPILDLIMDDD